MTLYLSIFIFLMAAAGVWFAGSSLAAKADELAERYNLARSIVGLLLLAVTTSLPEIVTTLTAAVEANAALLTNNLMGGITLQTAVLAMSDFWARGALTNYPRKSNHALEAILLTLLLAQVQVAIALDGTFALYQIGIGTIVLGITYGGAIALLRRYDAENDWVPVDMPDVLTGMSPGATASFKPTHGLIGKLVLLSMTILVLGIILVVSAEQIADLSGVGDSFIGVTALAAATSLPELSTTIAAVRIGAYTMAISNIFGSNLIMIVLLLPADVIYRRGPLLAEADQTTEIAIAGGIIVTCIYLVGMIVRRKPTIFGIGIDSALVLIAYTICLALFYTVS